MQSLRYILAFSLCLSISVTPSIRIAGDVQEPQAEESFSFVLGPQAFSPRSDILLVGSADDIQDENAQSYALSATNVQNNLFFPLAPEQAIVNGVAQQPHPLHGRAIRFVTELAGNALAVADHQLDTVTAVGGADGATVLEAQLHDTNGDPVDRIIGLADPGDLFVAAVTPQTDDAAFGDQGSGILFGSIGQDQATREKALVQQDRSIEITRQKQELTRNNEPLSQFHNQIEQPVRFTYIAQLYTGFSVQAGAQPDAGARSVLIGRDRPSIPEEVLKPDAIVGTSTPEQSVYVHHLDAIQTSTQLPYLIVNGGVGDQEGTQRRVFALPIVNDGRSASVGQIAKRHAQPEVRFSQEEPFRLQSIVFTEAANTDPELMWSPDDPPVRVGNGDLPGPVRDIWGQKDAVFVAVSHVDADASFPAGVYYSQAILDASGRVIGWSDWMPTAATANQAVSDVIFEEVSGQYILSIPDETAGTTRVAVTNFMPATGVLSSVSEAFSGVAGNIQGCRDILSQNSALSQQPGSRFSSVIMTGLRQVVWARTTSDNNPDHTLLPLEDARLTLAPAGRIPDQPDRTDGYIISGGDLDRLGAIVTADIGTDGRHGWFVVGGSDGVAILRAQDGSGWPVAQGSGLENGFANMPPLAFYVIPHITQVKKVLIDEDQLYIMSTSGLYRIPLSQDNLAQQEPCTYTVTDATSLCGDAGTFSDIVISGTRAVIATSCGLYISAPEVNVAETIAPDERAFLRKELPESVGPVTHIYTVSPTHRETDVARDPRGGDLYVISSRVSTFLSQIYRLAVSPESGRVVTGSFLSLYPDFFIRETRSYFAAQSDYRNFVFTNGAMTTLSRSRYEPEQTPVILEKLPGFAQSGVPFAALQSILLFFIEPSRRIQQPLHVSGAARFIVHGDFGIYAQQ